nr:MAG TPA: minor tail protein [Caudoviricetes sp.]
MELETLEIKIQAQARQASGQIDALVTRLGRLSSALSGLNTGNLNSLSTGVNRLAGAMTAMRGIDTRTFSAVARNISKLGSINSRQINAAAGSMRQISNALKGISGMSASVKGLTELASAIKQLGYQSSTKAIENIPKLAVAMRQLMSELSKAPRVSQNIIDMTNALARLARTGGAAGSAARSITSSFSGFSSSASMVTKKSFSLASAIGKVYATYWTLFRAFRLLRDAIDISSSLTEVENVVRQTFGQYESLINNFAKTSIEKFGMSELSAKQFASRFQAMGTALDIPQGQMAKMSIRLTELAGDMASFYDVSQEDIAKSLQSVFSGTTAPMRRYGIDLTQATLKEWALKQGLDANISSMTQAQKAMLRYQYVLAHTTNITGDFARTADTWHNQITMLKENFKALGAVVGGGLINAFKPFIKALNAVLQKVISFAEMVTNALGSIFGWKYEASKGAGISGLADDIGSASDGMDDLSDAAGSAGKNTGNVAKNAKKAKKEIQQATRAFDELKVISKQSKDNTSGSGSGGSGGGSGSGGSGGGDTGKLVQTDTIFKKFKSDIKDLEGLGKAISGSLINAMKGIKWDEVYAEASGFGSGLAKFLNGLFEGQKGTTLFGETGKLIANSLNTVLHGLDSFGTTFNWKQFGNSIADGINKFFQNFDFALLAQTLNAWAQGAFDAVTTALSKISWKDIWNGAKEFLSNLDVETVAIIIGAVTIKKIGKVIFGAGILSKLGLLIKGGIVSAIVSALGAEKGTSIGAALFGAIKRGISGFVTKIGLVIEGLFSGMNFSEALASVFGGSASTISSVASAIGGIVSVVTGAFTAIYNFVQMLKNGFSWLNEALMVVGVAITTIGVIILAPIEGIGIAIAALVGAIVASVATITVLVKEHWEEIKGIFSKVGEWFNTNVIKPISGFFKGLWESVSGFFSSLWKDISGVWKTVSGWFNTNVITPIVSFFQGFSKRVGQIFQGLWIIVKAVWIVVSDWFKSKVIEPIKKNFELLKSAVSTAFKVLWTTVKSVWTVVSGWFKEHVTTPIKNAFSSAKESIQKAFSSAKTAITGVWNSVSSWFKEHVTTPIKNAFSKMKESVAGIFGNLWKSVKSGVSGAMNSVIARIESAINSLIRGVNKVLSGFNNVVSVAAKVAGVDWSGVDLVKEVKLPRVKAYATGGFMDKYSIAKVGENGIPEIMGTVGGKPAVAGGQEITGIKDAINSTSAQEVSLLRQQNQLLQAILQKNFGITTNDIGKAARDYGREHYNRTGDNVYVF